MSEKNGPKFNDFLWPHFTEIAVDHENRVFAGTSDIVECIGGKPLITLEEFVQNHRDALIAR
jgi:hypothetical protein